MPRRKGLKDAGLVPQQIEEILRPAANPLTLEERGELRAILSAPLMRKVWNNARWARPGAMIPKSELNSALGSVIANNRLHEQRGWEMFEAAILIQIADPKIARKEPIPDNYPDAGMPK